MSVLVDLQRPCFLSPQLQQTKLRESGSSGKVLSISYMMETQIILKCAQGTDLETRKQRNKNIIVFLFNNPIWANKKGETKLYFLHIGRNKIVHQEEEKYS